jgi:hypothetical protein
MALISGVYDDGPRNHNLYADARYQRFLAHLESLVDGEPGRPRATPESFEPVEAQELIDGPAIAPPPEKPRKQRKRKPPRRADMPARDPDSVNLAKYVRKLTGQE